MKQTNALPSRGAAQIPRAGLGMLCRSRSHRARRPPSRNGPRGRPGARGGGPFTGRRRRAQVARPRYAAGRMVRNWTEVHSAPRRPPAMLRSISVSGAARRKVRPRIVSCSTVGGPPQSSGARRPPLYRHRRGWSMKQGSNPPGAVSSSIETICLRWFPVTRPMQTPAGPGQSRRANQTEAEEPCLSVAARVVQQGRPPQQLGRET